MFCVDALRRFLPHVHASEGTCSQRDSGGFKLETVGNVTGGVSAMEDVAQNLYSALEGRFLMYVVCVPLALEKGG